VVIDFNDDKREYTNSETNMFLNEQSAVVAFSNGNSGILKQIDEDTKLKFEAGSKDFHCGTTLQADTESSLDGCLACNDQDWQLI
jgi:hypothetical protein